MLSPEQDFLGGRKQKHELKYAQGTEECMTCNRSHLKLAAIAKHLLSNNKWHENPNQNTREKKQKPYWG